MSLQATLGMTVLEATATLTRVLAERGVTVLEHVEVTGLLDDGDEVVVDTATGPFRGRSVVVTAGGDPGDHADRQRQDDDPRAHQAAAVRRRSRGLPLAAFPCLHRRAVYAVGLGQASLGKPSGRQPARLRS